MNPTDIRIAVLNNFLKTQQFMEFEALILTGSMVFSKYTEVNNQSDIDLILIYKPENISKIQNNPFLKDNSTFTSDFIEAFESRNADRFWVDYEIDNIKLNLGFWSFEFLEKFCNFEAQEHCLATKNPNAKSMTFKLSDGNDITFTPEVESFKNIYIRKHILKVGEKYVESPTYSNLIGSEIIIDNAEIVVHIDRLKSGFKTMASKEIRKAFLQYIIDKVNPEYYQANIRELVE